MGSRFLPDLGKEIRAPEKTGSGRYLPDIPHQADDLDQLAARLTDVRQFTGGAESRIIGILSGGSFRPQAILGRRAETISETAPLSPSRKG